ncbi:MAG: hypothetical protein J7L37_04620 [Thermococcus sp.]|nr:hypothetical protein [Thermococcus sp.]
MPMITAKKVGRRHTGTREYPIVYIPSEFAALLDLRPGRKVILVLPDEMDHFEVWPFDKFIDKRRRGEI